MAAARKGRIWALPAGLLTAGVMALAAWLYPLSGGQSYAIGAVMSTLGVAIAIVLRRRWDGRMLEI